LVDAAFGRIVFAAGSLADGEQSLAGFHSYVVIAGYCVRRRVLAPRRRMAICLSFAGALDDNRFDLGHLRLDRTWRVCNLHDGHVPWHATFAFSDYRAGHKKRQ
jgi:hypothetical protein